MHRMKGSKVETKIDKCWECKKMRSQNKLLTAGSKVISQQHTLKFFRARSQRLSLVRSLMESEIYFQTPRRTFSCKNCRRALLLSQQKRQFLTQFTRTASGNNFQINFTDLKTRFTSEERKIGNELQKACILSILCFMAICRAQCSSFC